MRATSPATPTPPAIRPAALQPRDAARYLGLAVSTLKKMRLEGKGPRYAKSGSAVLYRITDLDEWLEEQIVR